MLSENLKNITVKQIDELKLEKLGIKRDLMKFISLNLSHVLILSGVRRCGKSTLLKQLIKTQKKFYFFNFEVPRAFSFEITDFEKLDETFKEEFGNSDHYFFDEMQNVIGWERIVRGLHDKKKKVILTGSNASLLSRDLGTKLTGRHITFELFPFSYKEWLVFRQKKAGVESFKDYFNEGGFPEFLKQGRYEILQELFEDIITRDIITKYGIRETKIIKEMAIYLLSNISKEISFNSLKRLFGLGSTNTAITYVSYYEDSYLLFTVPKFDYSYKKQLVNPKKIYSIDIGLSKSVSASFTGDMGRILENIVFLALRNKYKEIFYFKEDNECDFVIRKMGKVSKAIQVCYELNENNKEREINGLKEAMDKLSIEEGIILTFNQKDNINNILVKPVWEWLCEQK